MSELSVNVSYDKSPQQIAEQTVRLDLFDGWDELSGDKQAYLTEFCKSPLAKYKTAMNTGVSPRVVDQWFNDEPFASIAKMILNIYTETYKEIDAHDAIDNSKIRNRVIQSLEKGGRYSEEPKQETHNHLHLTLPELLKMQKKND